MGQKTAFIGIVVTSLAAVAVSGIVNLVTDRPSWTLTLLLICVVVIEIAIASVLARQQSKDANDDRNSLITAIQSLAPTQDPQKTRTERLDLFRKSLDTRRIVRLRPFVSAARLPEVVAWMRQLQLPPIQALGGQVRVLVAPMGSGKTELGTRWLEEGLADAYADEAVAIPLWIDSRDAAKGLESAIQSHLSQEATSTLRVLVDNLDGVGLNESAHILAEARRITLDNDSLAILITTRPGPQLLDDEVIVVEPWSPSRGAELAALTTGEDLPNGALNSQNQSLLSRPLSALALAKRATAGKASETSRLNLLSEVVDEILSAEQPQSSGEAVWLDLAQLAAEILNRGTPVRASFFGNEAKAWKLTSTDLVINEAGLLRFALPLFEQHFAAHALVSGIESIEEAVKPERFPNWRYAVSYTIATARSDSADALMERLSRINAAAASWVIDEIDSGQDRSDETVEIRDDRVIVDGHTAYKSDIQSRPVTAGLWLRNALKALLQGFGPVAALLSEDNHGKLTQWGFGLQADSALLAVARDRTPPPEVTEISSRFDDHDLADGWSHIMGFSMPLDTMGRWRWARKRLQEPLKRLLQRRALNTVTGSALDKERTWFLVEELSKKGSRRLDPTDLKAMRDRVAEMMVTVERSVRATWSGGRYPIESSDVRWVHERLSTIGDEGLKPCWPSPDLPRYSSRWMWETYSPTLTQHYSREVIAAALLGYRDLVRENLPTFGESLALYRMFPVRFDALISRHNDGSGILAMYYRMGPNPDGHPATEAEVNIAVTEKSEFKTSLSFFDPPERVKDSQGSFYSIGVGMRSWSIGGSRPASDLAYSWLVDDLRRLGVLPSGFDIY